MEQSKIKNKQRQLTCMLFNKSSKASKPFRKLFLSFSVHSSGLGLQNKVYLRVRGKKVSLTCKAKKTKIFEDREHLDTRTVSAQFPITLQATQIIIEKRK